MPKTTSRLAALATGAALLLVAACGGGDDASSDGSSTTAADTSTTSSTVLAATGSATGDDDDATTTAAETTTSTTAATTTTSAPEPAPDTGECLVGAWRVTQDQMNLFYGTLMSQLDAPVAITATGFADLTFNADGTYGWLPAFDLAVDVAGQTGTGNTTGSITGNWTASDGVVTTSSEVNALVVTVTVGGATFAGSDLANGILNASPVNGVTYSCVGPTPVLDFHTSLPGVTVPITLTPA